MSDRAMPASSASPAWTVLDRMTHAVIDAHWQTYGAGEFDHGMTREDWEGAKEGHFQAVRDDMVEALLSLEAEGLIAPLDWDADAPDCDLAWVRAAEANGRSNDV